MCEEAGLKSKVFYITWTLMLYLSCTSFQVQCHETEGFGFHVEPIDSFNSTSAEEIDEIPRRPWPFVSKKSIAGISEILPKS